MLHRFISKFPSNLIKRFLLTPAYSCDSIWNNRLNGIECKLSANDLAIHIQQNLSSDTPISPIDFDILMNKINEIDIRNLKFVIDIIKSFRRTQSSQKVFESSSHAAIRNLIEITAFSQIIDFIRNRETSGIFLDEISVNMLLDEFITKKQWENAFFTSVEWVLQDCLSDSKLAIPLGLISCLNYWKESLWKYEAPEVKPSKEPIEYKWVPYLKPNGFDDHFDLCKDCHRKRLLGKCISMLIGHLNTIIDNEVLDIRIVNYLKNNLGLLGLALHEKLDLLMITMETWLANNDVKLNSELIAIVTELISSVERTNPDNPVPHPTFTEEKVTETLIKFQDLVSEFKSKQLVDEQDLVSSALVFFASQIDRLSNSEVDLVARKYEKFNADRRAAFEREKLVLANKEILKESKAKLLELTNQEEYIKYFENIPEIMRQSWLAQRTLKEKQFSCRKSNIENLENLEKKSKPKFVVQFDS